MKAMKLAAMLLVMLFASCRDGNTGGGADNGDNSMDKAGNSYDSNTTGNGTQAASASYDTMTEGKATSTPDQNSERK